MAECNYGQLFILMLLVKHPYDKMFTARPATIERLRGLTTQLASFWIQLTPSTTSTTTSLPFLSRQSPIILAGKSIVQWLYPFRLLPL